MRTPEDVKRHLREVINLSRDPLRQLVAVQGGKLDDIFGYVCWADDGDALLTIVSLNKTSEFLDAVKDNPHKEYLTQMIPEVMASPAQGKLRTMFHLGAGIFNVAVQLYPGASA
jgi:hypothetical protein